MYNLEVLYKMFNILNEVIKKHKSLYGPNKIKFKTVDYLMKEYGGKRYEYGSNNIFLDGYSNFYIDNEMTNKILNGKPISFLNMRILNSGWILFNFPPSYYIHKDWIDNSPEIFYNDDIDKLFKEPL